MDTQNSLIAPIHEVNADSKAVIMSKQEETGVGEEELLGLETVRHVSEKDKRNPADIQLMNW